jgi:hypothetical protein
VALALVFRPDAPLDSIALLTMKNPSGVLVRSVHYWSAQLFLVGALFHIADILINRKETSVTYGVWLRLTLTVPVILYAMLSGFLLRGDADSQQGLLVFRALLHLVPVVGGPLVAALAGNGATLFVLYLHHVATATFVIWLTTIEHSRRILPGKQAVAWILPPLALLSFLLVPGLGEGPFLVEKGPWYLVGLQEILHWLPIPAVAVWFALAGLAAFALLPKLPQTVRSQVKRAMLAGAVAYAVCSLVGLYFRGEGWRFDPAASRLPSGGDFRSARSYLPPDAKLIKAIVPMVGGTREGCLSCHGSMTGFSPAHDPKTIGCAACHLGDRFTLNKDVAHAGMTLTPGNLSEVGQTCATSNCHADIEFRVRGSLMNTMSGVVAVDKCVFGETSSLDGSFQVARLAKSPADTHLRQLCASCHLGQDKKAPAAIGELTRGGGCSACHLGYGPEALVELRRRNATAATAETPLHHPDISTSVPADACFGCHSRSGRISTNYEGWHEVAPDQPRAHQLADAPADTRVLADGRLFTREVADVHFDKGMICTDCHLASEVMGDGSAHAHEGDAVKIACTDCHSDRPPPTATIADLDQETQKIVALRKLDLAGRRFVRAQAGGVAYPNVFLDDSGKVVLKPANGPLLLPKPPASACRRDIHGHQAMECRTCHSAWAPQCISCHTSFDQREEGWDHLAGRFVRGAWLETGGDFRADPPVLGVVRTHSASGDPAERIATFVPGMVMTLDKTVGAAKLPLEFHRLYAPASPHTIVTRARSCDSCHADSLALGFGRGSLKYEIKEQRGHWKFTPAMPRSAYDGLPVDAWIGFMEEPKNPAATRTNVRPFNLSEQRRMLLVGACLRCHSDKEPRMAAAFADFTSYRGRLSSQCILPDWTE